MRSMLIKFGLNIIVAGSFLSVAQGAAATAPKETTETAASTWKQFTSTESGFSVNLPKIPDHVHQKIDVPKTDFSIEYDTYVSEPNESVVYVISVWHYPAEIDMSKPEVNLQDGFSGMVSALPGSKILNMKMGEVGGFKSLEFLVKNDDIYFQGKLILVYNTLYQVFTVYKDGIDMTGNYVDFVNSFKLLNPAQQKVAPESSDKTPSTKMNV